MKYEVLKISQLTIRAKACKFSAAVLVILTLFSVAAAIHRVNAALTDTYDVSSFPTMWGLFSGNITLDDTSPAMLKSSSNLKLLSTTKLDDGHIGYVYEFGIGVKSRDLSTLSLDDLNRMSVDPAVDAWGEEGRLGTTSFLGSKTEKFENETNVDGVTEYFFYNTSSFDSDDYQYLLVEDASTPSDTNSKIIVGTAVTGNVTIFDDIIVSADTGDMWFRLDDECSNEVVYNITITDMKLGGVSVFCLRSDYQWADSRYCAQYVGEDRYTAAASSMSINVDIANIEHVITRYEAKDTNGQGIHKPIGITGTAWLEDLDPDDFLAARSSTGEFDGIVRASGWLSYQDLEEDLLNAISTWEGIDVAAIDDYACSNGIMMFQQTKTEVVDYMHSELLKAAERTNDVQALVDSVRDKTIANSVFLIGTEPDVFGSAASLKSYLDHSNGATIKSWENFVSSLKQAAEKVYDTTTSAIASIGSTIRGSIQWGQDLISDTIGGVTGTVTGLVDSGGEIAKNVVGAVTTKSGALSPMGWMDKIRNNLIVVIFGALGILAILTVVIVLVVRGITNSKLASNTKLEVSSKDLTKFVK